MAKPIPSDLPTIAKAVEQQLLNYVSPVTGLPVCGDITNIYWIEPGLEPEPGQTGQRDVLLAEPQDVFGCIEGGGGIGAWIESGLDVYLRTSLALDPRNTRREWFIEHRNLINGLMDALMGFFPVDAMQNALTIEGFVARTNASPQRIRDPGTWGYTVGSYSFHYLPNIAFLVR